MIVFTSTRVASAFFFSEMYSMMHTSFVTSSDTKRDQILTAWFSFGNGLKEYAESGWYKVTIFQEVPTLPQSICHLHWCIRRWDATKSASTQFVNFNRINSTCTHLSPQLRTHPSKCSITSVTSSRASHFWGEKSRHFLELLLVDIINTDSRHNWWLHIGE